MPRSSRRLRNDVVGAAGLEHADRDDRGFDGSTLRETIDCSAVTICAPTRIGSIAVCGRAACPPTPSISDVDRVGRGHDRTAAGWRTRRPAGPADCACRRPRRWRSAPSGRPSPWQGRRRRLPPRAGRSPPPCRRNCASRPDICAAPSSIAVWPSWPQACILPGTVER